jgi:L-alanine-DL-glutamate epimerase-like enolase superfamily enzyme
VAAAAQAGFRLVIVPLRPHYDRRLAATVVNCGTAVAFDLGGHYRRADSDALRAVARLGPRYMAAPFPDGDVVQSARLRRDLEAPLAVGGLMTAEAVESGHMIDAYDIVGVDPGRTGLTEAVRIADYLHERSVPTLVRSSARLELGARADLAFARHPAASLPVEMGACLGDDGRPWPPRPSLEVGGGPGVGVRPGREALTAAAEVHVRLEA